jgi:hypothetical protein
MASPLDQLTISKLYSWWAVDAELALRCEPAAAAVHLAPLKGWVFMPSPKTGPCQTTDAWQPPCMCHACLQGAKPIVARDVATTSLASPRPEPDLLNGTSLSTWRFGQLTRFALKSVGPCAQELRDRYLALREQLGVRRGGPTIALHVRRGDACEQWMHEGRQGRRQCYPFAAYMEAARRLRTRYPGASHILLATDSPSVVAEARGFAEEFSFTYLRMNRSEIGGAEGANMHRPQPDTGRFIESLTANRGYLHKSLLFGSILADVQLLQTADILIGDHLSTVTKLVLAAMVGRVGRVPPFVFLGGRPVDALWSEPWPPPLPFPCPHAAADE